MGAEETIDKAIDQLVEQEKGLYVFVDVPSRRDHATYLSRQEGQPEDVLKMKLHGDYAIINTPDVAAGMGEEGDRSRHGSEYRQTVWRQEWLSS